MTRQKSFKKLVRTRMEKTGESYTAARAQLLGDTKETPLPMSEAAIRERTGRGWEEWFDLLDEWGAGDHTHKEIARWLDEEHGSGGWNAQSITVGYERARRGREVGQQKDGFQITATKTVAVPVERLYDGFVEHLADGRLRERTATRPKGARYDWEDGRTRVIVGFEPKGEGKSVVALAHEKLADADEAERMKSFWRERVAELKEKLEA